MCARIFPVLIGLLGLSIPAAAQADLVTFRYESTTVLPGGASTPVVVLFTFDRALADGTGSFGLTPTNGSYGPWSGTLTIGSETVSLSGGTIEVFNNAGTTSGEDGYDFRWQRPQSGSASSGTLLGGQLCFFRVVLVDTHGTMFSSTALPAEAGFAAAADYVQDNYQADGGVSCASGPIFGKSESPGSTTKRAFALSAVGATPAGASVEVNSPVTLPDGATANVSLTFDQVETTGVTAITASAAGPAPPSGFKLTMPSVIYDVQTTATFTGSVRVCLGWIEGQIANESEASIFHFENDQWIDITDRASRDTTSNTVCGRTSSLSPFTLMEVKYPFTGFFAPVDKGMTNAVKAGAAVPVRFSLGGDLGLNIFAAGFPVSRQVLCETGAPIDAIEETVTAGGNSLSYEPASGRYIYVWKSDKAWTGCRELVLKLADGEEYRATFTLRK